MQKSSLYGQLIGWRYRVGLMLENRGYGAIYRAEDTQNGNTPCLLKHTWDTSFNSQQHLEEEVAIPVNHPSLPIHLNHFFLPGQNVEGHGQFRVLNAVEGKRLRTLFEENNGPLHQTTAVQYMLEVCAALAHLHNLPQAATPIIHKHISPDNIIVTPENHVVLRDYGLTRIPDSLHADSRDCLTHGYAAPEQYSHLDEADVRADVYCVSATLYFLVTGHNPLDARVRQINDTLARADSSDATVPSALANVIEKGMMLSAGRRYQTILELQQALQATLPVPQEPIKNGLLTFFTIIGIGLIIFFVWMFQDTNTNPSTPGTLPLAPAAVSNASSGEFLPPSGETAIPTQTPAADLQTIMATVQANQASAFEPLSGVLISPGVNSPAAKSANINAANFSAKILFTNPEEVTWNYGFAFRYDQYSHFRFAMAADQSWRLDYVNEDPNNPTFRSFSEVHSGKLPQLNVGSGEQNSIQLIALGNRGFVLVNDQFLAELNLTTKLNPGEIFAANALYRDSTPLQVTYADFTVHILP